MDTSLYTPRDDARLKAAALKRTLEDAGYLSDSNWGIILDGNCGPGAIVWALREAFQNSMVIGVDCDKRIVPQQHGFLCANLANLPFRERSIDLVFTNLVYDYFYEKGIPGLRKDVPMTTTLEKAVNGIHRVLKQEGIYVPFVDWPLRQYLHRQAREGKYWRANGEYIFEKR